MSVSTSLRATPAPQHFERIAKNLLAKRQHRDYSTCDIKVNLKDGSHDLVHHMVVTIYSEYLSQTLANRRAPYPPINMQEFDAASVRRVFDWMYSGEINIPEREMANDLAVASFLRVNMLQYQFEQNIRKLHGKPVEAINIASCCTTGDKMAVWEKKKHQKDSFREENAFRPHLTLYNVRDDTMNQLVMDLVAELPKLTNADVNELTNDSILACMSTVLPLDVKIPVINLAIQWILNKKCSHQAIIAIVESIVISDVTMETLYSIRYNLKQYLSNPELAGKGELSINRNGVIGLTIDPRKGKDQGQQQQRTPGKYTSYSNLARNQYCVSRTKSEIETLRRLPDVFGSSSKSSQLSSPCFARRETTDGFPKYFTRSEVENLRAMDDPFISSTSEAAPRKPSIPRRSGFSQVKCTAPYSSFSKSELDKNKALAQERQARNAGKWTPSDYRDNKALPDPFLSTFSSSGHSRRSWTDLKQQNGQKKPSSQGPILLKPAANAGFDESVKSTKSPMTTARSSVSNSSNASFSSRPYRAGNGKNGGSMGGGSRPDFVVTSTTRSSASTTSIRNPPMQGVKKTPSEIAEINALPSMSSSSISAARSRKSPKPAQNGQKKSHPRSAYLYPK